MGFSILNGAITPVQFKMCFTAQERIALRTLRDTDPVIADAMELIDDPRLTEVDLTLQSISDLLDYMTAIGVLEDGRKAEILMAQAK
jgi:hypothetical protein